MTSDVSSAKKNNPLRTRIEEFKPPLFDCVGINAQFISLFIFGINMCLR